MKPLDPALLPHLAPARRPLTATVIAGTAQGLLAVAQAFALGHLLVALVTAPGDDGWHTPALILGLIVLARATSSWIVDVQAARAAAQASSALRRRLLTATTHVDVTTLDTRTDGEFTVLATRGVTAVEPYFTRYLPSLVQAVVLPVATLGAIFALDWISGLIVVLTLPLIPVFAALIGVNTRDKAEKQWREMAALSGHFLDVVRGLPTLVAHRRANAQSRTIAEVTHRHRRATLDTLRIAFASSIALELIATISVALVAVIIGLRLAGGHVDFTTAFVVLLLAPEAYWPWRRVGAEFHSAAEGTATFAAVEDVLARGTAPQSRVLIDADHTPSISLDAVSLTRPGREVAALAPVSHQFPTRGLVAVTGPSGVGKSTLLHLISGELAPTSGRILIDGAPLSEVDREQWRALVALGTQRTWLTPGTIAENLRHGLPDATDEAMRCALRAVDLLGVVDALPHGLDTTLGEDGAGLSAGQRARIGLARVILSGRPVVLLDEPGAHLDPASEAVMLRALERMARERLVIVVAHSETLAARAEHHLHLERATQPQQVPASAPQAVAAEAAAQPTPAGTSVREVDLATEQTGDLVPSRFGIRTGIVLGTASVASGVALTATAAWLITRASEQPPVMMLMVAIVSVRMFGLARPVLRYAERLVSHDAALRQLADRRTRIYDTLVPLVPGRLGVRRGDVLARVVDDVDALVDAQLRVRQPRATALAVGVLTTVLAAWAHPVAGVITGLVVAICAAFYPLVRARTAQVEPAFVAARADLSTAVEGWFASLKQYIAWGTTETALRAVTSADEAAGAAAVRSARTVASAHAAVVLVTGIGVLVSAVAMSAAITAGTVAPAMAALLVMVPLALADALTPLADAAALSVRTRAAEERLDELASLTPAVEALAAPVHESGPVAAEHGTHGHPHLALQSVSAGWEPGRLAVDAFDLDLSPGARVGLVGPSGCGKSTVAALLMRFIDPVEGTVRHDGSDLRQMELDAVRRPLGLVDDEPHVFASNVVENVRLARPEASDDEVLDALLKAELGPWLATLPHGIRTMIGEGHGHVSGGERARIAMARSLLADQPVLILDEPTAHLDAATAAAVTTALLAQQGRTIVWITHQRIGLDQMDRVITMQAPVSPHAGVPADERPGMEPMPEHAASLV